jgi:hypothetical protein
MALPKIEHPIYPIYLKSLDRKVNFRPFLVKEEKILLMAKEAKTPDEIQRAVKQIISNCLLEEIDIDSLPLFDVEMAFLKLRAKSVGEKVRLVFNCKNKVNDVECDTDTDYVLDLEKIDFEMPTGHDPKVMISDKLGIKLKYPTLGTDVSMPEITNQDQLFDIILNLVANNVEYIFDGESVYKPEETPHEELVEFLDNLTPDNLEQIKEFFNTSPKVVLHDKVSCKKCGFEHNIHAEDLLSFFV